MHIALFGGSFDPPHKGHLLVGLTLLEQHIVDEVWYVPVKKHPFGKNLSPDEDRVALLKAMIASPLVQERGFRDRLKVSTHELDKNDLSYSLRTLTELSQLHPEHQFCWVIGSDNVRSFTQWYQYQELLNQFVVWVYPRAEFPMTPLLPGMRSLQAEQVTVSSTQIRECLAQNLPITELVEPAVEQYINTHHLYVASPS